METPFVRTVIYPACSRCNCKTVSHDYYSSKLSFMNGSPPVSYQFVTDISEGCSNRDCPCHFAFTCFASDKKYD